MYDEYGLDGMDADGMDMEAGLEDLFRIFGGGPRKKKGAAQKDNKKIPPLFKELKVTLDNIYNGTQINLEYSRTVVCRSCEG